MLKGIQMLLLMILPIFYTFNNGNLFMITLAQILLSILIPSFTGPANAFMNKLFPTNIKFRGMAFFYCLGSAILGGTLPLISTFLIKFSLSSITPAIYLFSILFVCMLFIKTKFNHLQQTI